MEMAKNLKRRAEDHQNLDATRRIERAERREHATRAPEKEFEEKGRQKGDWFHGETEWYSAVVPLVTWQKSQELQLKKLTDMVGVGIHVDDIITTAGRENIEGWNRFLLFYLFQEAGLVSSPLKNSTGATTQVDFNGFLVGRNKIKEERDQRQVHEGRFVKERLAIELRDSTRHKLRQLIDRF
jgi:hypothetical protein